MHFRGIELGEGAPKPARGRYGTRGRKLKSGKHSEAMRLRRETEDVLSQRLFSIILAVHAAETSLIESPKRLSAILELIHTQSAASLEDIRRLGALR